MLRIFQFISTTLLTASVVVQPSGSVECPNNWYPIYSVVIEKMLSSDKPVAFPCQVTPVTVNCRGWCVLDGAEKLTDSTQFFVDFGWEKLNSTDTLQFAIDVDRIRTDRLKTCLRCRDTTANERILQLGKVLLSRDGKFAALFAEVIVPHNLGGYGAMFLLKLDKGKWNVIFRKRGWVG